MEDIQEEETFHSAPISWQLVKSAFDNGQLLKMSNLSDRVQLCHFVTLDSSLSIV